MQNTHLLIIGISHVYRSWVGAYQAIGRVLNNWKENIGGLAEFTAAHQHIKADGCVNFSSVYIYLTYR